MLSSDVVVVHSSHLNKSHLPGELGGQKLNPQTAQIHLLIKAHMVIQMQIAFLQSSILTPVQLQPGGGDKDEAEYRP